MVGLKSDGYLALIFAIVSFLLLLFAQFCLAVASSLVSVPASQVLPQKTKQKQNKKVQKNKTFKKKPLVSLFFIFFYVVIFLISLVWSRLIVPFHIC
jgi:hypothetical protein